MFSTEHTPLEHTIVQGICRYCLQRIPGHGTVYTSGDSIFEFTPDKSIKCNKRL